jgi:hypothetical protein
VQSTDHSNESLTALGLSALSRIQGHPAGTMESDAQQELDRPLRRRRPKVLL